MERELKPAPFMSPVLRKRYSQRSNKTLSQNSNNDVKENNESPSISPLRKRQIVKFAFNGNEIIKKEVEHNNVRREVEKKQFGINLKNTEGNKKDEILEEKTESETEETEEIEYFLILKRPYFFSKEKTNLIEVFTGIDHDFKLKPPLPYQIYSVREDRGVSLKYVRSTIGTLFYHEDDGFDTKKIPLGFNLTPFPILRNEDSPLNRIDILKKQCEVFMCKKCFGIPFDDCKLNEILGSRNGNKGVYCRYCGKWVKIDKENINGFEQINKQIGSFELVNGEVEMEKGRFKNIILIFEMKYEFLDDFFYLTDHILVDILTENYKNIEINFCIFLIALNKIYIIDGDIRNFRITELLDYNDKDFNELENKDKGFLTLLKTENNKKINLTIPVFDNHKYPLNNLEKQDWFSFFDILKTEEFLKHNNLDQERATKWCNMNGIEIALHSLKNVKNSHIINFSFSFTLEYIWGNSDMGLMDIDKKYKEMGEIFLENSVVYEAFVFTSCNLERHSRFSSLTGGFCTLLLDFLKDVNKAKILKSNFDYIISSPIYYNVKIKVIMPKEVRWVKWHSPLNENLNEKEVKFCCLRPNFNISLIYDLSNWNRDLNFYAQFHISYRNEKSNNEILRVFTKKIKPSSSIYDFYKSLDSFTIGCIILRKYLSHWRECSTKKLGNKMLDFFEKILNKYHLAVYFLKNEKSEFAQSSLFDDMTIPETLDNTLIMLYSSVKKNVFRDNLTSKDGEVFYEFLKFFNCSEFELQSFLYPRITSIDDLLEDGWDKKKDSFDFFSPIETPPNQICTVEDMSEDKYLVDFGDRYTLFIMEDKEGSEKDVQNSKLEFDIIEDPEVEFNESELRAVYNFIRYLNSQRIQIPEAYIFEKLYEEYLYYFNFFSDIVQYPAKEDIFVEDEGNNILSLEGFKEYLDDKIDGKSSED